MKSQVGRASAVLFGTALCASLLASPASASFHDQQLCPPGIPDQFTDDEASPHEAAINCAVVNGLVRGVTPTTFAPDAQINRAQAATLLVQFVEEVLGAALPLEDAGFTDIAGSVHADNINKAWAAYIVNGVTPDTYRPGNPVTRQQFISLAVQTAELLLEAELPRIPGSTFDDDDGSVHEINIEKAVDNGLLINISVGDRALRPTAPVTRGEATQIVVNTFLAAIELVQ